MRPRYWLAVIALLVISLGVWVYQGNHKKALALAKSRLLEQGLAEASAPKERRAQFEETGPAGQAAVILCEQRLTKEKMWQVRPFGNGVYHFPFVGNEFRETVSYFLSTHTNLEVVTCEGDVGRQNRGNDVDYKCDYGVTIGYTVFFREKQK